MRPMRLRPAQTAGGKGTTATTLPRMGASRTKSTDCGVSIVYLTAGGKELPPAGRTKLVGESNTNNTVLFVTPAVSTPVAVPTNVPGPPPTGPPGTVASSNTSILILAPI